MVDPSSIITTAPSSSCVVGLTANMACIEVTSGITCSEFNQKWFQTVQEIPLGEQCVSDPFGIRFVYNGGGCNQTLIQFEDDLHLDCQDMVGGGGPPVSRGEASWVEIYSANGSPRNVYFSGVVHVGDPFHLILPDEMESFADTVNIYIYDAVVADVTNVEEEAGTTKPGALLQRVQLPFYCMMENIGGLDRYGAVQFVGFASTQQGYQSYYSLSKAPMSADVTIALTNDLNSNNPLPLQLKQLNVATNFEPFFYNFTNDLHLPDGGSIIPFGQTFAVNFQQEVDMAGGTLNALLVWEVTTQEGEACRGHELLELPFEEFPSVLDNSGGGGGGGGGDAAASNTGVEKEEGAKEGDNADSVTVADRRYDSVFP